MFSQVHTCISYIDERNTFSQHTATLFYITFYFFRIPDLSLTLPHQGFTDPTLDGRFSSLNPLKLKI